MRRGGLTFVEHRIDVPLDHGRPDGETIEVFAREVRADDSPDKPVLLFLQGGPGGESPRPATDPTGPSWLKRALEEYRVVLLDQRGTGLSTPVGTLPGMTPEQQADYLACFRADSIVEDCELLRRRLGVEKWSLLGQSFGGFCSLTYLSRHAERLREVYFTGGLPPVGVGVDEVYQATYSRTIERVERFYRTFPQDRDKVRRIVDLCDSGRIVLPTGEQLSSRRFRCVGSGLGMSYGADQLHYLLERDPQSPMFGASLAAMLPFGSSAPLYTLLQEACYADGGVTGWSGDKVRPAAYDEDPTLLTAEHVFPALLDEVPGLHPLREAGGLLAQRDWPRLFDEDALRAADVPCAAAVYYDDPYVLREFSMATAALLPRLSPWITNEYLHDGLRAGDQVLGRLFDLAKAA